MLQLQSLIQTLRHMCEILTCTSVLLCVPTPSSKLKDEQARNEVLLLPLFLPVQDVAQVCLRKQEVKPISSEADENAKFSFHMFATDSTY